jgi:hypothetical protein
MSVKKVFGPPGAGKTTYLLSVVEQELAADVHPTQIGYFAFTRKAATEARDRAIQKFPALNQDLDFPWFRTLHSLAYRCLGITGKDMMGPEHYAEFAKEAGIELGIEQGEEEFAIKANHPILNEVNIARIKGKDLRQHYNESRMTIEWHHFEYVDRAYRHYKASRGLLDFTDLLERIVEEPERLPSLEMTIIDEAQDLSRLQWRLVEALSERSKRMYIAGDDDQCQPVGTKVLTTEGEVDIQHLDPKVHRLVCYDRTGSYTVGHRQGYAFKKASRFYSGLMYKVRTHQSQRVSHYTHDHHCIVRWRPLKDVMNLRVVYLMQKGEHFRIGQCQLFRSDGCVHAWVRAHGERADRMWFLKVVDSAQESTYFENLFSYGYGIPQTIFHNGNRSGAISQKNIDRLFEALPTRAGALRLLDDCRLSIRHPIYDKSIVGRRRGGSQIFETKAVNLIPEAMLLAERGSQKDLSWSTFDCTAEYTTEAVYSLDVEKHHNYFADGILTHNCIYNWAGADVDSFLNFEGDIKVLEQSYRVPSKIHALADRVVNRIRKRQPKIWKPRTEGGTIAYYNDFHHVDVTKGEWLVLAAANYMLTDMHEWLKSQGLLFERHGQRSLPESVLIAVMGWERLRKGGEVSYDTVKTIYKYLDTGFVKRGHKGLKTASVDTLYTHASLTKDHGLLTDAIWHEALTKIGEDKRNYLIALLRRGVKVTGKVPIKLSTIHGAKGGEADNVLLISDLSTKFAQEYERNSDDINRLLYVGLTRAKQSLHIVLPKNTQKGFRL